MATRQRLDFEKSLIEALKSESVIKSISDAIINTISREFAKKFTLYDAKIASLEAELEILRSNNNKLNDDSSEDSHKKLEQKVDSLEQRSRNKNIRIIGYEETDGENVLARVKELFVDKLNVSMSEEIVAVYRVGKVKEGRPRQLLVTFNEVSSKNLIYMKKKYLKGTGLAIKEDLTLGRLRIVQEASEKYGFKNVWTFNGSIFAKSENGREKILSDF